MELETSGGILSKNKFDTARANSATMETVPELDVKTGASKKASKKTSIPIIVEPMSNLDITAITPDHLVGPVMFNF